MTRLSNREFVFKMFRQKREDEVLQLFNELQEEYCRCCELMKKAAPLTEITEDLIEPAHYTDDPMKILPADFIEKLK